ncbi:MAG: MaoC family dehydratase N-terminal domain-containing protein [Hyphomicrobiales bacterium]|nr:MaoC family dehydratase N-terminal domain-containing protein [Hyphomicrobiales bacterium]
MPINLNALGAETPWTQVTVTQRQIDALCSCLGDYNPLFLDEELAAQSANGGIVAPPTMINCFRDFKTALVLSEAEVDLPLLLHGEQVIHYYRPLRPGDTVWHKIKVIETGRKSSRTYGELNYFTVLIKLKNDRDEKLVEATQLFFVRDK